MRALVDQSGSVTVLEANGVVVALGLYVPIFSFVTQILLRHFAPFAVYWVKHQGCYNKYYYNNLVVKRLDMWWGCHLDFPCIQIYNQALPARLCGCLHHYLRKCSKAWNHDIEIMLSKISQQCRTVQRYPTRLLAIKDKFIDRHTYDASHFLQSYVKSEFSGNLTA